jgi:hypothetical protein
MNKTSDVCNLFALIAILFPLMLVEDYELSLKVS